MKEYYDVIIVGTGAAGLYCALNLPERKNILMITKRKRISLILFWLRAASVCFVVRMTMRIILRIPCGPDIMKIIKRQ